MRALVPEFNTVILAMAPRFEARAVAPSSLAELVQCHAERGPSGLIVWEGESTRTVYADAAVNHAFRAWHDAWHVAGRVGFDLEGERATCNAQKAAVLRAFPRAPLRWFALLDAEINGQAEYFARTGAFPADQVEFTADALRDVATRGA
jgi:hypothetical protein